MKVSELIERLKLFNPDHLVAISGNTERPFEPQFAECRQLVRDSDMDWEWLEESDIENDPDIEDFVVIG